MNYEYHVAYAQLNLAPVDGRWHVSPAAPWWSAGCRGCQSVLRRNGMTWVSDGTARIGTIEAEDGRPLAEGRDEHHRCTADRATGIWWILLGRPH